MRPGDNERRRAGPPAGQGGAGSGRGLVPEDTGDTTQELPPGLLPSFNVRKPPLPPRPGRQRTLLIGAASVVALVAIVFGVLYTSARVAPKSALGSVFGCSANTPCGVTQSYLNDFTSGNYVAMYGQISNASRQRFSDKQISHGPRLHLPECPGLCCDTHQLVRADRAHHPDQRQLRRRDADQQHAGERARAHRLY